MPHRRPDTAIRPAAAEARDGISPFEQLLAPATNDKAPAAGPAAPQTPAFQAGPVAQAGPAPVANAVPGEPDAAPTTSAAAVIADVVAAAAGEALANPGVPDPPGLAVDEGKKTSADSDASIPTVDG